MPLQPALLGGLFIGVLSALPIVSICNCCCLWVIGGGVLSAYLDQQQDPRPTTAARGAMAGLLAGAVGAVVWLMVSTVVNALLAPLQDDILAAVARNARDLPPELREWLDSMAAADPSMAASLFWFGVMLIAGSAFSALGGSIAATYFRKDVPPALGGPVPPPPLP
jgi:hypothetical protein